MPLFLFLKLKFCQLIELKYPKACFEVHAGDLVSYNFCRLIIRKDYYMSFCQLGRSFPNTIKTGSNFLL